MIIKQPTIYSQICEYISEKKIRLSAPGHKGNVHFKAIDMFKTDIAPNSTNKGRALGNGFINRAEKKLAEKYGTVASFYLTNGTECGIHIMASAMLKKGDKVLVDRLSSKAVIQSVIACDLVPVFIDRSFNHQYGFEGGLNIERLDYAMSVHSDAKAVFVQSVTPHGIVSDMERICETAHRNNMLVLCDETYGGHFSTYNGLPHSALEFGADIVVQSASDMLGALSGGALLHINNSSIDIERIKDELNVYQSHNVSMSVICALDNSIHYAFNSQKKYEAVLKALENASKLINSQTEIYWLDRTVEGTCNIYTADPMRITLSFAKTPLTGYQAYEILRKKHKIECDFADSNNVVLSASIYNSPYDIRKLTNALNAISYMTHKLKYQQLEVKTELSVIINDVSFHLTPYDAYHSNYERIELNQSRGHISRRAVCRFPTMTPIILPGEKITSEHIELIFSIIDNGGLVDGINENEEIDVVSVTDGFFKTEQIRLF